MKVILVTVLSIVFLCSGCSSNIKEEQKSIKICSSLNETMTDILAEDFAKQQNVKLKSDICRQGIWMNGLIF